MTLKVGIAALGLMVSSSIFAAVTVSAPEEIVILAVNDQEVNAGLFRTKKNDYKVDAGKVSLSLRYQQYFEHLNGEHDIVKSGVITITAPDLQDGQQYKIALVNAPENYDAAKKYAEQPTVAILDKNNQMIVQQTGANNEPKPWLTGGLFGRVFDLTSSKKTPDNQPAPVYATSPKTVKAVSSVTPGVSATTPTTNKNVSSAYSADQQLIQIWKNASKAERQKFMSWLADQ